MSRPAKQPKGRAAKPKRGSPWRNWNPGYFASAPSDEHRALPSRRQRMVRR